MYLGVADAVGPDGNVCDHVIVMKRMPDERRLSTLVLARSGNGRPAADDGALDDEVREVARTVAAFHASAATSPEIAAAGAPEAVRDKVERDLRELAAFAGDGAGGALLDPAVLDDVARRVRRFLTGRFRLLRARVELGLVRDGHGDLLADDVFCLDDGPRILDCIEFDDRLRYGDVLADVAFLAMDLERLGAPDLAARFLGWYAEFSGEHHPATLVHYYVAFRALIRAKVACIRAGQGDEESRAAAASLLELAARHLRRARVVLVLVGGAPGTGKSTLAGGLAEATGWAMLRSDRVRKELSGVDPNAGTAGRPPASFRGGIYRDTTTAATYDELLVRARHTLELGEPVILDASWTRESDRAAAAAIAAAASSDLVELRCDVPAGVAAARITERRAAGRDPSDATPEIAARLRAIAGEWSSATTIDTSGPPGASLRAALAALDA